MLRRALGLPLCAVDGSIREALMIRSVAAVRALRYGEIAEAMREARNLGYPVLD